MARVRPPPKPPPEVEHYCFSVWCVFLVSDSSCFSLRFVYFFVDCKTICLDLEVGDDLTMITVTGSVVPTFGSASYITEVVDSDSGSRDGGFLKLFCLFSCYPDDLS
ncbi:unnamed protein product [Cuscuta epithymum]|uniref:Uncharacterized protein n=1 Tax=Cuscuta epithymum TaxID=186058 RepID=A0AAV0GI04_9ASTE|nr:unnamed protein product [Cuscuta epithymum]